MKIEAPATPGHGIEVLGKEEAEAAVEYCSKAEVAGKAKFVPASGAASRMFKDLFSGLEQSNEKSAKFAASIKDFAFYDPSVFPEGASEKEILEATLLDKVEGKEIAGLGYGSKPKGVLKFHRYASGEIRTALAEHLVEAQDYMRNSDGSVNLTVTISPEHRPLFEQALADIKGEFEARYGVRYIVDFVYQDKDTDTWAVDMENRPFLKEDGSTGLQILEGAQINPDDPQAMEALHSATHFNPVDLVCCLKDYEGNSFDLLDYVDEDAGFISSKSYQGRELKALELPGLWNGSMSRWNTLFVEVPLETFNPVKTVLDLLRPAHQEVR